MWIPSPIISYYKCLIAINIYLIFLYETCDYRIYDTKNASLYRIMLWYEFELCIACELCELWDEHVNLSCKACALFHKQAFQGRHPFLLYSISLQHLLFLLSLQSDYFSLESPRSLFLFFSLSQLQVFLFDCPVFFSCKGKKRKIRFNFTFPLDRYISIYIYLESDRDRTRHS